MGLPLGVALMCVLAAIAYGSYRRAHRAEALALRSEERRHRFFATAARDLEAPLLELRRDLVRARDLGGGLDEPLRHLDDLRGVLRELGRLRDQGDGRAATTIAEPEDFELSALVGEILDEAPFRDRGPSVVLHSAKVRLKGDRARLHTGLRMLLWAARRDVAPDQALTVTLSALPGSALLEIESPGTGAVAAELAQLPARDYGLVDTADPTGASLALRVAEEVARVHGGRLAASGRIGPGERFVLELPAG
jgi:signal transduction histidine kinase